MGRCQGRWRKLCQFIFGATLLAMTFQILAVVMGTGLLISQGCSTPSAPPPNPDTVRQHADAAFQQLRQVESPRTEPVPDVDKPPGEAKRNQSGLELPAAQITQTPDGFVRATGYGNLSKGLYLCQHMSDLAARVELSKLIRVQVKERSVDRLRERTRKDVDQDIEVVREGLVNEVLTDVKIVDRTVDQAAGTCSSTAEMPKKNLQPKPGSDSEASPVPQN